MSDYGQNRQGFNWGGALSALGQAIATNRYGNVGAHMQAHGQNRMQMQEQQKRRNMTADYLEANGADPQLVEMARGGMAKEAFNIWGQQQKAQKPGHPEKFGLNPIYGRKDGKLILMQPGTYGSVNQMELPEGVEPLGPFEKSSETSRGREIGKQTGQAQFQLTGKQKQVQEHLRLVDEVVNHPSLGKSIGPVDGRWPDMLTFDTGVRDFRTRVQQITGTAFLQARQDLKGGGQITDFEGQKAEQALLRAEQSVNERDFQQAMLEYKAHIERGYAILQEQAGVEPSGLEQTGNKKRLRYNPQTGELE